MSDQRAEDLKDLLVGKAEPVLVDLEMFLDGNDDEGSFGCNLVPHPGMKAFRDFLSGLKNLEGFTNAVVRVAEIDPGEDLWPYTDTVLLYGEVDIDAVKALAQNLQPDEIYRVGFFSPHEFKKIAKESQLPITVLWWD